MEKSVLITVGTTEFDELLKELDCVEFIELLITNQFQKVFVQNGRGIYVFRYLTSDYVNRHYPDRLEVTTERYVKDFNTFMKDFHFIIGHAGAGTLLDILSLIHESTKVEVSKVEQTVTQLRYPYIMTINDTLQENHQLELATALARTAEKYFFLSFPHTVIERIEKALTCDFYQNEMYRHSSSNASLLDQIPIFNPDHFKAFVEDTLS
jgi:UDP-N-acetylglucosamine transferase subunit ALG13